MNTFEDFPIIKRDDGSYVVQYNGYPYHVVNDEEMSLFWKKINDYVQNHPDQVIEENESKLPTEEELIEIARNNKLIEFDNTMSEIDNALIRSTTDLMYTILTPSVIDTNAINDDTIEKSKKMFIYLKEIQSQNRILRNKVVNATTKDEINSINPISHKK